MALSDDAGFAQQTGENVGQCPGPCFGVCVVDEFLRGM